MNKKAIAVIDSGVGGLACLREIRKAMPNEDFVYFGDTAHMPLSNYSAEEIQKFASDIIAFLDKQNVKMTIVACNTMSSVAINDMYKAAPNMLVQGILDSALSAVVKGADRGAHIGVVATPRTIESKVYETLFAKTNKDFKLSYRACPKFSVLVEQGIVDGPIMEELLKEYLEDLAGEEAQKSGSAIDTLLFACTHYPLASDCVASLYPNLRLIDPSETLAKQSAILLKLHGLAESENEGSLKIYVSKKTESFAKMAESLGFGDAVIEEVRL